MSRTRICSVCGRVVVLSLLLVWAIGCAAPATKNAVVRQPADRSGFRGTSLSEPYTMPEESLDDTSGRAYNLATTPSTPVKLLFFGYTSCPDVCGAVLSDVALALSRMDQGTRQQIQMIVVTTDPGRDSEAVLRDYLDRFDPTFIGLTGDLTTITSIAERVGVDIQRSRKLPGGGYEVGHSAQVIGFDRHGKGVVLWTPSTPVGDLQHDFEMLVARQQ